MEIPMGVHLSRSLRLRKHRGRGEIGRSDSTRLVAPLVASPLPPTTAERGLFDVCWRNVIRAARAIALGRQRPDAGALAGGWWQRLGAAGDDGDGAAETGADAAGYLEAAERLDVAGAQTGEFLAQPQRLIGRGAKAHQ